MRPWRSPGRCSRRTAIPCCTSARWAAGLRTKLVNNALNAAHFALAHDAMAIGKALDLDPDQLGAALKSGSGRSYALEVFVGLGSFEAFPQFADLVGPIMAKDIALFAHETEPTLVTRDVLLAAADRFLSLLDHPRPADRDGGKETSR